MLIALVKLYQLTVLSVVCRPVAVFNPPAPPMRKKQLSEHGLVKGLYLSFLRIMRCHPFCKGGYDPVPSGKASRASQ